MNDRDKWLAQRLIFLILSSELAAYYAEQYEIRREKGKS